MTKSKQKQVAETPEIPATPETPPRIETLRQRFHVKHNKALIGAHPNIPNDTYHAGPGLSSSQLKTLGVSAKHFVSDLENSKEPSPAMLMGTAIHTLTLEGDEQFNKEFIRRPDDLNARTKAGKEQLLELQAAGKTILSPDDWETIQRCREAVYLNRQAAELLQECGVREVSGYWADDDLLLRYRPDARSSDFLLDLKTTARGNTDAEQFTRICDRLGYVNSAAHYLDGDKVLHSTSHETFAYLVVENAPPFDVAVFIPSDDWLLMARDQNYKWRQRLRTALNTDEFPGIQNQITTIDAPVWSRRKWESEL
jgi:exodeoxyribonuclease VIII